MEKFCPKCGSSDITFQREQSGSIGVGTNRVTVKKSHGCLWWMCIGWWYWLFIGWWKDLIFGGGLNIGGSKNINRTMAVCQNCGHSWKV